MREFSPIETIKFLGVRERFIILGNPNNNGVHTPYMSAIREIEKIASFDNPFDMVSCLSNSYA